MAKYSIVYACGHSGTVNLYGSAEHRALTMDWLITQDYPRCRNEKTLQEVAKYELPVLTGSEKQKAWRTEKIIEKAVRQAEKSEEQEE